MTARSLSKLLLIGTRTPLVRSSHPITCDGCYLAQVVAGGESQLLVVVAGRLLSDFTEAVFLARSNQKLFR